MAIDRRVARTRTALYDALVALIRRKDYDDISVQDILDEADVGRSTFYAHFRSKDELLGRSLERLRALLDESAKRAMDEPAPNIPAATAYTRALFEHIAEYRDVQAGLAGTHASRIVLSAIRDNFADFLRGLPPRERPAPIPRELSIAFIADTFITVIGWWLERKPSLSAAEAEAMFRELVGHGVELPGQER